MAETQVGSYDDAPESEVSTFLQVPLLWRVNGVAPDASPYRRHDGGREGHGVTRRHSVGRNRSSRAVGRHRAPEPRVTRVDTAQDHERAAMVHTLRVGLVSALLVLGLFAMALLVLAQLQP